MNRALVSGLMLLLFSLGSMGCRAKSDPEPEAVTEPEKQKPATPAEPKPATEAPKTTAEDEPKTVVEGVPTPEDFEDEAAERISAENLEEELDRLEAEIRSD